MDKIFKIRCSAIGKIIGASKKAGELSQTCKTYLHEWYANDNEPIHSKYFDKGNSCENDVIDMMSNVLGLGIAEKNVVSMEDDFFTGTCDVELIDAIVDTKAPWNNKSFLDSITEMDSDYEFQGRGYMRLYNKPNFILFYGLVDTPEHVNYGNEVSFEHLPLNERWIAFSIKRDLAIEMAIVQRVIECREYLEKYDVYVKSKIGKINEK